MASDVLLLSSVVHDLVGTHEPAIHYLTLACLGSCSFSLLLSPLAGPSLDLGGFLYPAAGLFLDLGGFLYPAAALPSDRKSSKVPGNQLLLAFQQTPLEVVSAVGNGPDGHLELSTPC